MNGSKYIVDKNGERRAGCFGNAIRYGIGLPLIGFLLWVLFSMCGCKTQTVVTVPEIRKEYIHDTINRIDSIYEMHIIKENGDTVWRIDSIIKWRFKEKIVEALKVDSVPYPVEVQVPVRYRSRYDKFTSWFFWIVVVLVLLWGAYKVCDKIPACKGWMTALKVFLKII